MSAHPLPSAVIITALGVETSAVLRHLSQRSTEMIGGTGFFRGSFEGWDIAVVEAGAGNAGAAAIAMRALTHYKPKVAMFVGVAGGVKDVKIGDVVVADKVYAYESGKDTDKGFKTRAEVQNAAHELQQRARLMRQQEDWKKRLDPSVPHAGPEIYVAAIAAGEKVVASQRSRTAKLIREHYSDAVAVEMEGFGFLEGVHLSHPILGCVVRGISDLLSNKAEADKAGSQQMAADSASAVAFEILAGMGAASDAAASKAGTPFIETPSTFSKGAYFPQGEVLAQSGVPDVDQVSFSLAGSPDGYIRLIPMAPPDRPIPIATLHDAVSHAELIRNEGYGGFTKINRYGAIRYEFVGAARAGSAHLRWATQVFPNGELWSFTDKMIIRNGKGWPSHWPVPRIPSMAVEQSFIRALHKNVAFAVEYLGLTFPCQVELGLLGIRAAHVSVSEDNMPGPIHFEEAVVRAQLPSADPDDINAVLLQFFTEVFDKTGYRRPANLHGFPPRA